MSELLCPLHVAELLLLMIEAETRYLAVEYLSRNWLKTPPDGYVATGIAAEHNSTSCLCRVLI